MFYKNFEEMTEMTEEMTEEMAEMKEFWMRAKSLAQEWVKVENLTENFDFQGIENIPKVQAFLMSRALDCLWMEVQGYGGGYYMVEDRFDLPGIKNVEMEVMLTRDWKPVLQITNKN